MQSYVYPTNNFGNHNNTHFYFYSRYVNQGNNWSNYGLHMVEVRNDTDSNIEVVGWQMKEGRVEEDFKSNIVRPGLFYTARLVPSSWGTFKAVIGAVTFKVQSTGKMYTLAFEDPFHDYINKGFKGHIQEGNDGKGAIAKLHDHSPKQESWGRYDFMEFDGRGKSVITIGNSAGSRHQETGGIHHPQVYNTGLQGFNLKGEPGIVSSGLGSSGYQQQQVSSSMTGSRTGYSGSGSGGQYSSGQQAYGSTSGQGYSSSSGQGQVYSSSSTGNRRY